MENSPQIILASASPRRAELLSQIGVRYRVEVADIEEVVGDETPQQAVVRLATEKAQHIQGQQEKTILPILGADTIVVHREEVLQKPTCRADGLEMLSRLSGETHQVMSAVTVVSEQGVQQILNCSEITFRTITEIEREAYWDHGESSDKAGGYAVQGMAAIFIANLKGSYSGVMGLPLFETAQLLRETGVKLL
ncbi:MAG: septum formation inhibitor Maf [Gammaproteobacteria bacterium]|jgi:septum formation protein|nr:septum formation inhibitor Maf [Gammaproteobacteria bacterium]MBT4810469.1 septum formation inhibitor Maf [Thiotrichales bacterium]MBT3472588.1 septum formation inhibitor Maf [Gammaproteobacteria bacterium]MBT3966707.1 septum formation inhibitor Maf [Gammaproteobacteria bacterium]MBT4081395.1 septum formation inhibitor Maf [Gammaproteobacteria bacterium]